MLVTHDKEKKVRFPHIPISWNINRVLKIPYDSRGIMA